MKKLILYSLTCLSLAVLITGCSSSKGRNSSSKTGIPYADRKSRSNQSGAFAVATQYKRAPGPGLIPIEGGVLVVGGSAIEVPGVEPNIYNYRRQVTVPSFYMDETEVSNTDWLEYLHWIRYNFPEDQEFYYNELPDTLVWRSALSYNEPYVNNYLRHPAYRDYPVVGVSWEQASRYCEWRTSRANEFILREKGILTDYRTLAGNSNGRNNNATAAAAPRPDNPFNTDAYLNGQYNDVGKNAPIDYNTRGGAATTTAGAAVAGNGRNSQIRRTATLEDGVIMQPYRLPTEAEWEYAALGLIGNTEYENINQNKIYPWNGLGVSSAKKKTRGLIQANFKRAPGDYMGVGGSLNDKGDLTVPVIQYAPNDFGLYNMAGNVNEWVNDVYRTGTFTDADAFNPYRGNYFTNKKLEDAQSGKIALDKYGNPIKVAAHSGRKQTWAEKQAHAKMMDSISRSTDPQNPVASTTYQADQRGYRDRQNTILNEEGVTLVNDKSRVYKGGSWNDMAYWLNPATRRFMQQDESSAEVGFRCAMTMLGAPEISTAGKRSFNTPPAKPYRVGKGK
ncbi:SUMF1/EgtB/PvdO family nonheme iron enzyme [Pedobacter endophyticus]|uniref:SUMF1/EgtB/PvdO family nonheme iron enzyme n=1 Tax=Pedobacter endophyticus TaxID=2789740 RepID=A0A7U3SPM0_9SPHI|nr:SUMF1/EgtB/PvdO family nonheme iron enzyme [Pedobacter endophyticus]QPH38211.1 SUMF1/EgtB/PvdO family nonheme iron enzyme [Pedobacter endophyticus]